MSTLIKQKTASGSEFISPATYQYQKGRIFLTGPIDDSMAEAVCQGLVSVDSNSNTSMQLIINSPGGSVTAGLAIIDTMRAVDMPVYTHVLGTAASMAALIAACGEKGHRTISPLSEYMIHQPLMYGAGGQASDIAIAAEAILRKKEVLNTLLADATGKSLKQIEEATDRDTWLNAEEAVAFGLADEITKNWVNTIS